MFKMLPTSKMNTTLLLSGQKQEEEKMYHLLIFLLFLVLNQCMIKVHFAQSAKSQYNKWFAFFFFDNFKVFLN